MSKVNKYLISVDIEGITGVVNREFTSSKGKYYSLAQRYMVSDVNAVIAGILRADLDAVVLVRDAHGRATNLDLERLHPRASLLQGWGNSMNMVEAIDETYSGVFLVGYHAGGHNNEAVLAHTSSTNVHSVTINNVLLNETGIAALYAGHYGVPVAFVSGDDHAAKEAKQQLGENITAIAVKQSIARDAAISMPLIRAQTMLESGAHDATLALLHNKCLPFSLALPLKVEARLYNTGFLISVFSKIKSMLSYDSAYTFDDETYAIKFTAQNAIELFQRFDLIVCLVYAMK